MIARRSNLGAAFAAFLIAAGSGTLGFSILSPALSQTNAEKAAVDAAKQHGIVGEQGDGFLGFVSPPTDPNLAAAVAQINNGRAALYRDIAARTKVSPEAAGQATANELFQRLPPGQYYRPLNGNWTRK